MHSDSRSPAQEVLAGVVERVTFHNEENGFCVLRTKARGQRDLVTVVGQAASISAGEWITASGEWLNDRTHGLQFRARFLQASPPTSLDGIEALSSSRIRSLARLRAVFVADGSWRSALKPRKPVRSRQARRRHPATECGVFNREAGSGHASPAAMVTGRWRKNPRRNHSSSFDQRRRPVSTLQCAGRTGVGDA